MSSKRHGLIEGDVDLNAMFNLNYNFDVLKYIIENLLKNQKELINSANQIKENENYMNDKIIKLEHEIIDSKLEREQNPQKINELLERKEKLKTLTINNFYANEFNPISFTSSSPVKMESFTTYLDHYSFDIEESDKNTEVVNTMIVRCLY